MKLEKNLRCSSVRRKSLCSVKCLLYDLMNIQQPFCGYRYFVMSKFCATLTAKWQKIVQIFNKENRKAQEVQEICLEHGCMQDTH